jgi:hypothetical protein
VRRDAIKLTLEALSRDFVEEKSLRDDQARR